MTVTTQVIATAASDATGMPRAGGALRLVRPVRAERARPARWRRTAALLLSDLGAGAAAVLVVAGLAPAYHPAVSALAPLVWLLALGVAGAYRVPLGAGPARPRAVLVAAALLALVGWAAVAVAPQAAVLDPGPLARSTVLLGALAAATTLALRAGVVRLAHPTTTPVVLAGEADEVGELLRELGRPGSRLRPVALCLPEDAAPPPAAADLPVFHDYVDLPRVARGVRAAAVLTGPSLDHALLRRLGHGLQDAGVALLTVTRLRDVAAARLHHATAGTLGVLEVRPAPLRGPARVVKAAVDRLAALTLLVLLAPALLTLVVVVRRDSPGPAIYRQVRIGRDGRPFTVYKFRTMDLDADRVRAVLIEDNESDRAGVLFKIRHDPRITRVGALLRRYSLDELPQLLNVVRGEMSLIGPRPALPAEVAAYDGDLARRLVVRPGMTGLWQVSGRSDLDWEETVRLDLAYVDNWSWRADLAIAARTLGAVLGHRGAY